MARCRLTQGEGDDLIWDVVLTCDNAECEYHQAAHLLTLAGIDRADLRTAVTGALRLAHDAQMDIPSAAGIVNSAMQYFGPTAIAATETLTNH